MAMGNKFGTMGRNMKANGNKTRQTDKESYNMLMVIYMKVNGKTIKLMDMVDINMLMELLMKENGKMTNNTAKELRHGRMELNTKELILKAKNMEEEL